MKALLQTGYGPFEENLQFREIDIPRITEGEVLVKVHFASINPHDYKTVLGELRKSEKLKFPAQTGSDFSGVLVAVGKDVDNFKTGDEVYGVSHSALAAYCKADPSAIAKKPVNASFEEASTLPVVGMTTVQAFNRIGGIKNGDRILIHAGSGGIGTFALQYAKVKGAYIYTTTSKLNVNLVTSLGADSVIDYTTENYLDICRDLDIVYDTLGGQYSFDAFKTIKISAKVVSLLPAEMNTFVAKELGLPKFISFIYSLKPGKIKKLMREKKAKYDFVFMQPKSGHLEEITSLFEINKLQAVIEKSFAFEDAVKAFKHLAKGHTKGKLSINIIDGAK